MEENDQKEKALIEDYGGPLYDIIRGFEIEDESARSEQLKLAMKGEYFFRGIQSLYWDYEINDYRQVTVSEDFDEDDLYYTKVINIYRAHGESIIAAITVDVPAVHFLPKDAENSDDIKTAQNYTNASLLIQKQNNAPILFTRAMYLLWTQGFVAARSYNVASKDYGVVTGPDVREEEYEIKKYTCPNCGFSLDENQLNGSVRSAVSLDEEGQETMEPEPATQCPNCGELIEPEEESELEKVPTIVGTKEEPKTREIIEIFGVTHVKVRPTAKTQKDTPYLVLESEEHVSQVRFKYGIDANPYADGENPEEVIAREVPGLDSSDGNVTVKHVWFRPEAFFYKSTEEGVKLLKKFDDGAYGIFINGQCVKLCEESLDEHWTILEIPTSSHIHPDPLGKSLMDIQEIKNEIYQLSIQTMEQGISQTFVNNEILDLERYQNTEQKPGSMFPVSPPPGTTLQSHFYSTKNASLSQEIDKLDSKLDAAGQLVSGSLPSIYGGSIQGGSKTYAEYAASRQQALQRLGTPYKSAATWWANVLAKATPEYVENMLEDETLPQKNGAMITNLRIEHDVNTGKIGSVEPDSTSSFPLSWTQKRDILIELVRMNIPEINEAILTPENATFLQSLIGLDELILPGQTARLKQFSEIQLILSGEPVEVEEFDDHVSEMRVCLDFLHGSTGQQLKQTNLQMYKNIVIHLQQHKQALQPAQPPQAEMPVSDPNGTGRMGNAG